MRRMAFWGTCCVLSVLPFAVHAGGEVTFSEILFDPQGTDTGFEWIEIYNAGDTPADLTGWQLYPDGIGYFLFPAGFALAAKSFAVVHLRVNGSNSSSELYHPVISSKNMGNTAGSAALFAGEPGKDTIKSFVEWGKGDGTWESAAVKAGMWAKGTFVDLAHAEEGNAIALQTLSKTSSAASDWTISVLPTAGAASASSFVLPPLPASAATSSAAGNSSGSSLYAPVSSKPPVATIEAFAGEDRMVLMGTEAEFLGSAIGLVHEPITHARFLWNFGDGETLEGKAVGHVFRALGTYVVGLHVSSGDYAASDYLTVSVVSNQIAIGSVVAGSEGHVRLENGAGIPVDIGGWILEDDGMKRFYIPVRTVVGAHAAAAFANRVTKLFPEKRAALRRPDESLAVSWNASSSVFMPNDVRRDIPYEPVKTAPPRASEKPRLLPSARHAKEPEESRHASSTAVRAEALAVSALSPNVFSSPVAVFGAAFALSVGAAIGFFCLRRMIL